MKKYFIKGNKKEIKKIQKIFVSAILFLSVFLSPLSQTNAAINKQINYQGKLTTSAGVAVANGTYNMEFKLYNSVPSVVWTETRTGVNKVQVTNGLFSVMLGSVNPLTGVDFNQTFTLGVNIGGTGTPGWDGEMTPRKTLGSVSAAIVAETVTGAAQTNITSLGTLTGLTVTGTSTLRGLTVDNATSTHDRIAITAAATGAARFDGTITNADLTAARTWTFQNNSGVVPLGTAANTLFFTTSAATNVTLPTTGTLSTLAGSEALTNKSVNGVTLSTSAGASNYLAGDGTYKSVGTSSQWTTVSNDIYYNTGRVWIGATSEGTSSSKLYVAGTTAANGVSSAIAGILGGYTFNPTAGGVQVGNRFVVTNSPTVMANTAVGEIVRIVDDTSLANLVRGVDITANGGSNTAGTNTALRVSGATFGIQATTSALAGGVYVPAAIYGESTGTTQGDILRLYSNSVTTAPSFATFYQDTSAFTGTGLLMDFAKGSGSYSGNFLDLKNNTTSMFKVSSNGSLSIGGVAQSARLTLPAGTATAGTAPLKLTAGTNLGTTESGAVEYDGKSFFFSAPNRVGISTYVGANSDGNNLFVGNGGQSSVGAVGETYKGANNLSFGGDALRDNTTGFFNTAIGGNSMVLNTTGYYNVGVGAFSLGLNTAGIYNVAIGAYSLYQNTDNYNIGIGFGSLGSNTAGTYGVAIGDNALEGNISGDGNMGIGADAGRFITGGVTKNTTGSNSMFIGYATKAAADGQTNQTVIGYGAIGNGSNTVTIGNSSVLRTYLTGLNLKAGTAAAGTAPLKLTAGTNLTTAEAGAMEYDGTNLYFTPTGTTRKTFAYTSDIPSVTGFVPYTGATGNVDLGTNTITSKILKSYDASGTYSNMQMSTSVANPREMHYIGSSSGNSISNIGFRIVPDSSITNQKPIFVELKTNNNDTGVYRSYWLQNTTSTKFVSSSGDGTGIGTPIDITTQGESYTIPGIYIGNTSNQLVGIGMNNPTARLTLPAGTATANTAPLKFTSGTNLGTTEAGAVEYDGSHLYFTATNGGTRYQLDQQSGGGLIVGTSPITSGTSGRILYDNAGVLGEMTTTGSGTVVALATSPTFTTSVVGGASFDVFNTASTTLNAFGAATTLTIGGTPTTAITHNYSTNATAAATTKTVNLGTGGAASSTTNINIGASAGGTTTINSPTLALGTGSLTMTGSLGATGARLTSGWFTDLTVTNSIGGSITGSAASLKSNATTGVMQITGPAAGSTRVMTIPDANFTAARTDAAQTFTGTQTFSGAITANGGITTAAATALSITTGTTGVLTLDTGSTGTINIGTNGNAKTINIGNTGAAAKTVLIGNSAQANTVTIGSASATGVSITDNNWSISAAGAASFVTTNGLTITANGTNTLNIAAGKTLAVSNSLTLAGADGTTMTFPTTSATIARTDAAQSFTGNQTFDTDTLFVDAGNNKVGIGNTSPDSLLSINSATDNVSIATLRFPAGSNGDKVGILFKGNDGTYNVNYAEMVGGVESWSGDDGFIGFRTSKTNTLAERMRLTSNGTLEVGYNYTGQSGTLANGLIVEGRTFLGATSDPNSSTAKLYVSGSTTGSTSSSTAIAGILGNYTASNGGNANYLGYGNRFVLTNNPTTNANTAVGETIRVVDNTSLANLVRGLDVTANGGSGVNGVNTGIRGSGATFGIQGITNALAGGSIVPAAIYGETTGTTQGDILRLYSSSVTSAPSFATFYHETSTFTGTGLLMDFASGSGTFSGDFINLKNNSTSVFKVTSAGSVSMNLPASTNNFAVCHETNGAGVDQLKDCSGAPSADYAEMYPVEQGAEYGDIVSTGSEIVNTYDIGAGGGIDWTKIKGNISKLVKSNAPYQENVIGIVSDNHGDFTSAGYNIKEEDNPMPIALNGRVPVKIASTSSPIKTGDYLTTSIEEGRATRALKSGFVIGKALEDWTPESGKGTIMVFVEQGYYNGGEYNETTFNGLTFFAGDAEFTQNVVFGGNVEFKLPPLFNNDTAGFAVVKAGSKKVDVTFDNPYIATPVVNVTITFEKGDTPFDTDSFFNDDVKYIVVDKDENGFTIAVNKTFSQDIRFSWTALSVKDPKVFESVIEGLVIETPATVQVDTPTTPNTNDASTDTTSSPTDTSAPATDTSSTPTESGSTSEQTGTTAPPEATTSGDVTPATSTTDTSSSSTTTTASTSDSTQSPSSTTSSDGAAPSSTDSSATQ